MLQNSKKESEGTVQKHAQINYKSQIKQLQQKRYSKSMNT